MQRHHDRKRLRTGFNLVALMDIFTILVFFLLVNSSDVEVLPTSKGLKLPESVASKKPQETLVVMVGDDDILIRGKKIASVRNVMNSGALVIEALKAELDYESSRSSSTTRRASMIEREITIMGDREIPFQLLKRVMITCARANYTRISLAVLKKGTPAG
jgi:biopolymer transport protein ExbD